MERTLSNTEVISLSSEKRLLHIAPPLSNALNLEVFYSSVLESVADVTFTASLLRSGQLVITILRSKFGNTDKQVVINLRDL